jgi:transposase
MDSFALRATQGCAPGQANSDQTGEVAEVDFGRLGPLHELGSCQPRMVQGFIVTLLYSRLSCVIPVFKQDLFTIIDCFERAWEFFGGCPRRVVLDGMKACIDQADPYTPRFNRTFLEYANYRGFLPDPARPNHPQDKPVVENSVAYTRERFLKGEKFIDLDDLARRALVWCREDKLLMGAESAEQPAEQMSERHDHVKNLTETSGIQLCAKSFILQVYDVLARHSCRRTRL